MHSASRVVEQIETNDDAAAVSGNEALFKEMDLLQGCISRMAENSFRCKEWAVALAVAVLGLCYSDFGSEFLAIVSVFPLMFLWHMDCRYLSLERMFRGRYAFSYITVRKATSGDSSSSIRAYSAKIRN